MLLSDRDHLYCFCATKLSWITRKAPFGQASLSDADVNVDFGEETTPNDVVSVVATQPLTDNEIWHNMLPGDMLVLHKGVALNWGLVLVWFNCARVSFFLKKSI